MELYHYTTVEAVSKIITARGLSFLGTRYDSMNDIEDYTFAKKKILPEILNITEQLDSEGFDKSLTEAIEHYPYIVSFSEKYDDTHMWKAYGAEISIIVDSNCINRHLGDEDVFDKCRYVDSENIRQVFKEVYQNLNYIGDSIVSNAMTAFALIKSSIWKEEAEWRLFTYDYETSESYYDPNSEKKCVIFDVERPRNIIIKKTGVAKNKERLKSGEINDIILCKEFLLPKCALVGFIIRTQDNDVFNKLKAHLTLWLRQCRYEKIQKIKFIKSNIL